jgi:2-oxoisovalerate dehydrogenase E1 component beta subunit
VIPSSPARAYGLLTAAIRNPDPVIFLEPARLYRAVKHDISNRLEALPLDRCFTLKAGEDISIVTWGGSVLECLKAAALLQDEGISAEIIDVATVKPIDMETILASVQKTGRLLVVHEAARTNGIGAEIITLVVERIFGDLKTAPRRIAGYDTVPPYYRLEKYYLPSEAEILRIAKEMISAV